MQGWKDRDVCIQIWVNKKKGIRREYNQFNKLCRIQGCTVHHQLSFQHDTSPCKTSLSLERKKFFHLFNTIVSRMMKPRIMASDDKALYYFIAQHHRLLVYHVSYLIIPLAGYFVDTALEGKSWVRLAIQQVDYVLDIFIIIIL